MKNFRLLPLALACVCLAALFAAAEAAATPLFAMQAAENCATCHVMPDRSDPKWVEANYPLAKRECRLSCGACHVNPSGGMLRTDVGWHFGTKTLPLNPSISAEMQKAIAVIKDNGFLTFGGDFRFMDIITNQEDKKSPFFFPMQGDLYASARFHPNLSFLTQFGMERGGNAAVREAMGMVDNLPYNAYLKIGKFMPPYGHRLEDHTAFIRKELLVDHSNPASYNSGVEVGAEPLVAYARAAYFNQDLTPRQNSDAATTVYSGTAGWHGLWLQLGGSYLRINDNTNWGDAYGPGVTFAGDRTAYGVHGALHLWRFTLLSETDWRTDEIAGRDDVDALITFNELNFRAMNGMNVKARYETFDPDRDQGDDRIARYVVGLDFHPYPMTEVNFQYRRTESPSRPVGQYTTEDYDQYLFMIHFWF